MDSLTASGGSVAGLYSKHRLRKYLFCSTLPGILYVHCLFIFIHAYFANVDILHIVNDDQTWVFGG